MLFTATPDLIRHWLNVDPGRIFEPHYNIAPTQWVPTVRYSAESRAREVMPLRWGFVPLWATELAIGNKLINARSETVFDKNSFRTAIRRRRCIVPVSGFYEWKRSGRERRPYLIRRKSRQPFALAGVWEENGAVPEGPVQTFAVLTTMANALMEPIHERMPVILPEAAFELWLNPASPEDAVRAMLKPCPDDELDAVPVSNFVSNPANEGPQCLQPPRPEEFEPPVPLARKRSKEAPGQGSLFD